MQGLSALLEEAPLLDTLVIQDSIGKASNVSRDGTFFLAAHFAALSEEISLERVLLCSATQSTRSHHSKKTIQGKIAILSAIIVNHSIDEE